jgi:hypothetical protein
VGLFKIGARRRLSKDVLFHLVLLLANMTTPRTPRHIAVIIALP